jgi:hypothetical protein
MSQLEEQKRGTEVSIKYVHFSNKFVEQSKSVSAWLDRYKHDTLIERAETALQIDISNVYANSKSTKPNKCLRL